LVAVLRVDNFIWELPVTGAVKSKVVGNCAE